jgi:hypothetical protein
MAESPGTVTMPMFVRIGDHETQIGTIIIPVTFTSKEQEA